MKKKVVVLGCGMVGTTMARDLAADAELAVTVADLSTKNLEKLRPQTTIQRIQADLSDPAVVQRTIADVDVVLGALPSAIGFQTLRAVIEAGKPYCDISFMPEDAMELDELAKRRGVPAVVDCGVSPGLSNMVVGYVGTELDQVDRAVIYVGGLPKARHWPYQYKAPFAPSDVIEEYTRPARFIERGQVVVRPALSEPELIDFPRVGTLEAFNTDGLRTLLLTTDIPNLKEKTLRYPGHIELMRVLRETGFLDKETIEVDGVSVQPLALTSKLLFPKWTYEPGEEEFTVLRVVAEGIKDGSQIRIEYDLYDEYDADTRTSSMARTTAFPAAIVARLLARGEWTDAGVIPPELLARRPGLFDHIVEQLKERGVRLSRSSEPLA